jgi:hypothetical protein
MQKTWRLEAEDGQLQTDIKKANYVLAAGNNIYRPC